MNTPIGGDTWNLHRIQEENKTNKYLFYFGIVCMILTVIVFVFVCVFSIMNKIKIHNVNKCSINNCFSTECDIKTCNDGKCQVIFSIPGCCDSGINCTEQTSTANYAFDTICSLSISRCDPVKNFAIYYDDEVSNFVVSNPIEINANILANNKMNVIGLLTIGNIVFSDLTGYSISNTTNFTFTSQIGDNNNASFARFRKFGNAGIMFIPETLGTCNITTEIYIDTAIPVDISQSSFSPIFTKGKPISYSTIASNDVGDLILGEYDAQQNMTQYFYDDLVLSNTRTNGTCNVYSSFIPYIIQ